MKNIIGNHYDKLEEMIYEESDRDKVEKTIICSKSLGYISDKEAFDLIQRNNHVHTIQ